MGSTSCLLFLAIVICSINSIVGPPASIKKQPEASQEKVHTPDEKANEIEQELESDKFKLHYDKYLKEIVNVLETDPTFKDKVAEANREDFESGKVAAQLELVDHNVRTMLDELKRQELDRLRQVVKAQKEGGPNALNPELFAHLDHKNAHTFEVNDLNKLIQHTSLELDRIDQQRRKEFKNYEMEKHFIEEQKMQSMNDKEKEEYKKNLDEMKKKHANHEKIHHPGSKAQLEEVWDKQDHLENQDFDPKIFFRLHDINGDGVWDQDEVNALFIKELDKMYQAGLPEDDMKERREEMERMREHVFKEMDKNKDKFISYEEYIEETKSKEFQQDDGWETLDQNPQYSQKEYAEYEKQRLAEVQRQLDQGILLRHPNNPNLVYLNPKAKHMFPGEHAGSYYPQGPNQMGYHPQMQQHPNQQHPNQPHPNQPHPNQPHPNQPHPNQPHPNQQYPANQYHPNQMHQLQYYHLPPNPNEVPQHPGQFIQQPGQMNQNVGNQVHHDQQVLQNAQRTNQPVHNQMGLHNDDTPNQQVHNSKDLHPSSQAPINNPPQQMNQMPHHVNQMPHQMNQMPQQMNQMHANDMHAGYQGEQGHINAAYQQQGYHPGQGYPSGQQVQSGQTHGNQPQPGQVHPNQANQMHPNQNYQPSGQNIQPSSYPQANPPKH